MPPPSHLLTTLLTLSPYTPLPAEQDAMCRTYADSQSAVTYPFTAGDPVNITCWTTTSMPGDIKGLAQGVEAQGGSYIWTWASIPAAYELYYTAEHWGVGNVGEVDGGRAGGKGCWVNEDHLVAGDVDVKEVVEWCGTASRHQVGAKSAGNLPFQCRNCTDLADSKCQTVYNTKYYGWVDVGCWTKGTQVGGNDTWVRLVEAANCYISPDQFAPKEWHGKSSDSGEWSF